MEILVKNYTLDENEFWETRNIYLLKILKVHKKILLLSISLCLVLLGSKIINNIAIFYFFSIFIILYFVYLITTIYIIPFKRYKKNYKLKYKQDLLFCSEGIKIITLNIHSEFKGMETNTNMSEWILRWDKVNAIFDNNKLYILTFNTSLLMSIPKRLFEKEFDIYTFEEVLNKYTKFEIQKI